MDRGCLLAVQGEGMFGEDYQVFIPDGRAVGQVLVLGRRDPAAGGKQGSIALKIQHQSKATFLDLLQFYRNFYLRQGSHSLLV